MRAAGCVVNDICDRNIDKHVTRTKQRPLTAGELSLKEALIVLFVLLVLALFIVLQLPFQCLYYAIAALGITFIYPLCKRFFQAPQLILGLAFSMAIPMAYVASGVAFNEITIMLVLLNTAWIISYDTMYAMVDRTDDLQIGVRSTAILFASLDRYIIMLLQLFIHTIWLAVGIKIHATIGFYIFWCMGGLILIYQQLLVNTRSESRCFKAFLSNVRYGAFLWLGLIIQFM